MGPVDWTSPLSALFPPVQGAVLYALWRRPSPMTGREVHRIGRTGSYTGTLRALSRLAAQGIVDTRRAGQATEYSLNTEHVLHPVVDAALEVFTPRALFEDRVRSLVRDRWTGSGEVSVASFGSFARREATTESDIDLLVVLPDMTSDEDADALVEELERRGQQWSGNVVQVYAVEASELERAVAQDDPVVDAWRRDAVVIVGPDVRERLARRPVTTA